MTTPSAPSKGLLQTVESDFVTYAAPLLVHLPAPAVAPPKSSLWQREPALLVGQAKALLGIAAGAGFALNDNTTAAIVSLVAGLAAILGDLLVRRKVTAPSTAAAAKASAASIVARADATTSAVIAAIGTTTAPARLEVPVVADPAPADVPPSGADVLASVAGLVDLSTDPADVSSASPTPDPATAAAPASSDAADVSSAVSTPA